METKPKRIPHFGNLFTWKIHDAGYSLREALTDYETMEKVLEHTFETYPMDACYETGWRNPIQVTDSLGSMGYAINDEKNTIQLNDQPLMEGEEYEDLIRNPKKFLWETILPRKYAGLRNDQNAGAFRETLKKYNEFQGFLKKSSQRMGLVYGIPDFVDQDSAFDYWGNGYELLFCLLRGIKGLARDIKRDEQRVVAAIEALDETFVLPRLKRALTKPRGTKEEVCVDVNPVLLGHAILSPKHFEKFYWPHLKRIGDYALREDKLIYFFIESDSRRFWDFFAELPRGHVAMHVELDDIFEMKKRLPQLCMAGGMKIDLLADGTPGECVDYAKKLIDELGRDGGYIFSENKMLTFKRDCRAENLKAVSEFVQTYTG